MIYMNDNITYLLVSCMPSKEKVVHNDIVHAGGRLIKEMHFIAGEFDYLVKLCGTKKEVNKVVRTIYKSKNVLNVKVLNVYSM